MLHSFPENGKVKRAIDIIMDVNLSGLRINANITVTLFQIFWQTCLDLVVYSRIQNSCQPFNDPSNNVFSVTTLQFVLTIDYC